MGMDLIQTTLDGTAWHCGSLWCKPAMSICGNEGKKQELQDRMCYGADDVR
jgi:hypothetical protein